VAALLISSRLVLRERLEIDKKMIRNSSIYRSEVTRRGKAGLRLSHSSPRETEVLQAMAEGLDGQQVATRLAISPVTERNHVANILAKLGVHSRLQALVFALRHGVVKVR
jgi:DNA-binding NarL/FixJ family response regulator